MSPDWPTGGSHREVLALDIGGRVPVAPSRTHGPGKPPWTLQSCFSPGGAAREPGQGLPSAVGWGPRGTGSRRGLRCQAGLISASQTTVLS